MMTTVSSRTIQPARDQKVEFIRYSLPNGRRSFENFMTTKHVHEAATRIINRGYRFEVETLRNCMISATITDDESDVAHVLAGNTTSLSTRIDQMILDFDAEGNLE